MSLGRRLGRLARGFVLNINDERLRETIRTGRERGETLRDAFGAAWQGAAEEWRAADEEWTPVYPAVPADVEVERAAVEVGDLFVRRLVRLDGAFVRRRGRLAGCG